jgi:DNA-directed RNA polymerase sigma subunit (sigma70/sigma32)
MRKQIKLPPQRIHHLIEVVYSGLSGVEPTAVLPLLQALTPRQHDILWLHFGLGDRQERNLGEVAQLLGLSPKRVVQDYAAALRKLRHPTRLEKLKRENSYLEMPS